MEGSENASFLEAAFDDEVIQVAEPEEIAVIEEEIEQPLEDDAYNLLYRGELTDVVKFGSHKFKIKTLKIGEELEASLLASRYESTADSGRALATALVTASIVTVDGKPLIEQLGPKEISLEEKFDYITKNWYWITVARIYEGYDGLLARSLKVLDEVKKG